MSSRFKEDALITFCPIVSLFFMIVLVVGCVAVAKGDTTTKRHTEFEDTFKVGLNPDRDYLILVNTEHKYEFDGAYDEALQKDLVYVSSVHGEPQLVEKGTNLAFSLLKQHLRDEHGIDIELFDAYRTEEDQEWVCDQHSDFEGQPTTGTIDAPGYSERHTGLIIHIKVRRPVGKKGQYIWLTEPSNAGVEGQDFKTIHEHLADYGFIIRYPAGKEAITNSDYRPHEIRFVGSSEVAHAIADNNLCLEEYLEQNK